MKYRIDITNPGNHLASPLARVGVGLTYDTREEACEAIFDALAAVIEGENGCECVEQPDWSKFGEGHDEAYCKAKGDYIASCRAFIMREGYATDDGVTATVEEVAE